MPIYVFSIVDLIPYLITAMVIAVIYNSKSSPKKKTQWIYIYILLFTAIRYGIGYDFYAYKDIIVYQSEYQFERMEFLASYLMQFSSVTHYQVFFVVTTILTLSPIYFCAKRMTKIPQLAFVTFLLFPLFYLNFISIVRNAVSCSLALLAFYFFHYKKKSIFPAILLIVAFGFHKSTLFCLLLFICSKIKFDKRFLLCVYIASFCASQFVIPLLSKFMDNSIAGFALAYIENHGRAEGQVMTYLLNGICIMNFFFWNEMVRKNVNNHMFLTLFCIGICVWNVFLAIDSTIALRLSLFFTIFLIFIVPEYVGLHIKGIRIKGKYIIAMMILLMCFTFERNISGAKESRGHIGFLPYQTVFVHTDYANCHD